MSEEKKGFFKRLVSGLTKTRDNIVAGFDSIFSGYSSIDEDFYEELEEILIMGDIGINATSAIIEHLKEQVAEKHIKNPMECKQLLINSIKEQMRVDSTEYEFENRKSVILVIGVNGVGKTTSVGKLAGKLKDQGKKVILAAADTFRAAAGEQLAQWANRAGVDLIGGQEGADPASIVYLWKNFVRSTVSWKENIRKHIWKHWSFWMVLQDRMPWHRPNNLQKSQM